MFHPQASDSFEEESLVFSLPPPPPESPPLTPPPQKFSPTAEFNSELSETDPLLPPPSDQFDQSELILTCPDDIQELPLPEDDVITDIDTYQGAGEDAGIEATPLEELIVLPPAHFSGAFDYGSQELALPPHEDADYPPPSPLRASLNCDEFLDSLGEPPPPTEEYKDSNALSEGATQDTEVNRRNVAILGSERNTRRVTELLTAAANSLNRDSDGSDRPTEASELVRAALELIAIQSEVSIQ